MLIEVSENSDSGREVVIVANGKFPEHQIPLALLKNAELLVCCDGAINTIDRLGYKPSAIVGDLDSVNEAQKEKYSSILFYDADQDTNDLTKAVKWCKKNGFSRMRIIGATGLREDHTIGNIGLLPFYARKGLDVKIFTDYGLFTPLLQSGKLDSHKGQQISIFSPFNLTKLSTTNLKYPINNSTLSELWMGTLNESIGDWFTLDFYPGPLIVFQEY